MATVINNNIYFGGEGNTMPGNPADPSPDENPKPETKDPSKAKGGLKKAAGIATMMQLGKSVIGYASSHVGLYSGNSDLQDKVNAVGSLAATGAAIIANPAMGVAMAAFNLATKAIDYAYKQKWDGISTQQSRFRAGPSLNRSRLS